MQKFEEVPKIMWRVFEWAYDNDIEISLGKRYYHNDEFPVLRFSRGNKHMEQTFYPATDLTGQLDSIWRKIALELCVEPLNLDDL